MAYTTATATERVTFPNTEGVTLVGELDLPSKECMYGMVLVHGLGNTKQSHTIAKAAHCILEAGIACLRIDLAGNGESEGEWKYTPYVDHAEYDLTSAVHYLRHNRGLHVMGVLGHSMGGNIVMLYASTHYGEVPLVVNVCGRFFMKSNISKHFSEEQVASLETKGSFVWRVNSLTGKDMTVTQDAVDSRCRLDMAAAVDDIVTKAKTSLEKTGGLATFILTVHGVRDSIIPIEDAREYHSRLARVDGLHELHEVTSADHWFKEDSEWREMGDSIKKVLEKLSKIKSVQ